MVTTTRSQDRQTRSMVKGANGHEKDQSPVNGKRRSSTGNGTTRRTPERKRKASTESKTEAAETPTENVGAVPPRKARATGKTKKEKEETVVNELVEKKVDDEDSGKRKEDEDTHMQEAEDKAQTPRHVSEDVKMKDEKGGQEELTGMKDGKEDTTEVKEGTEEEKKDTEIKSEDETKAEGEEKKGAASSEVVEISEERKEKEQESSILETGIIYFFFRQKVSVEEPQSLSDVQRSYIIFRPLPAGAKLHEGALKDAGNNRLLTIPKKKFPSTGSHERLLTFVEKAKCTIKELKDTVLTPSAYETKTRGERTRKPARPVAEGVYAILKNKRDRQSHLAYILTVPNEPDELQMDFGLQEKGSFIMSVRNPDIPAPANVAVKLPAEFPRDMMEEFRGLRWIAALPKHLDFVNADILLIGEKSELPEHEKQDTAAIEQLEELQQEDLTRLDGSHKVFSDLELSKQQYSGISSTWDNDGE
ncbi:hypothetical protein BDZ91DRAFT_765927 [Kalaharituber pfeilii]|nr:hypothetical protein BDZ91DRAFT_765927 [Kalaharituber pfeilii]